MLSVLNSNKSLRLFIPSELLLLLVAIFWGTSYGLTKNALLFSSVLMFITIRFGLTFVLLLPWLIRDCYQGSCRHWYYAVPLGGILCAIFFCEVYGVALTSAANAGFLISLSMVFTALCEALFNRHPVSQRLVLLTLMSVLGVALLTQAYDWRGGLNRGDMLILAAALLRAVMVIFTKRLLQHKVISTLTLTAIQSLVVASIAAIILVGSMQGASVTMPTSSEFWLITFYLVVFCTLFAFFVQNHAVRHTSPTRVALLMGSEPLFAALFGFIWLHESLALVQILGASLIMVSVVLTSLRRD
ncbi:EamA-like transporter family protein [Vibrio xiamenensis]|uniref:EamA-like transporter family protein n=1 Tax=Vibrio xiamenensis TaxID=861298 RepID=A0A1G8HIB6_9VIBR|nr:DMT family transporter [Vibrio xiamenensis]SDI06414.1 EamA-like transporter family protein [Vibrio xiamenensis]